MRNLKKYIDECVDELRSIGIYPGKILSIEINTRAKKRLGSCSAKFDENSNIIEYEISINKILLNEKYPEKALKNTIIHELLHSCENCLTHKNKWKELAEKVNKELGYEIKRLSSKDHEKIIIDTNDKAKYIIKCENCGQLYPRNRRSKLVMNPENYLCGKCKGRLKLL